MQSNRKVAFNNFSFPSFFLSVQFLELKNQVKQSWAAGGDITQPQVLFHKMSKVLILCLACGGLDFMLHTEVAARGAASKALQRIPQKFCFLASHASSIKHPSPHWAQCSLAKWNVPEASDWSCLILTYICPVGRFTSLRQSIIQAAPVKITFCLAPNSPIPKSGLHLKRFPLTGV